MQKNKIKWLWMILLFVITIIEVMAVYQFYIMFQGVYEVSFYTGIILIQYLSVYRLLFKREKIKKYVPAVCFVGSIIIVMPILMILLQPQYTYKDGKHIVENEINNDSFILQSDRTTVPVIGKPRRFLIAHKNYYYRYKNNETEKYYMVNPID